MGKIDYAYSLEYGETIDAVKAHELYFDKIISDKTAFECCDENCNAKITCANMDKPYEKMKRVLHFKCTGEHSIDCKEMLELQKKARHINKRVKREEDEITKQISFGMNRPENHYIQRSHDVFQNVENSGDHSDAKNYRKKTANRNRKRNVYLLDSLVQHFVEAYIEDALERTRVTINLGKDDILYTYPLNKFFQSINQTDIQAVNNKHYYVYYGIAKIESDNKEGYIIRFDSKFKNNEKKVVCCLTVAIINECDLQRAAKESHVKKYLGKEVYCYTLGHINEVKNAAFINIRSLDHIAFSEYKIDSYDYRGKDILQD